MATQIVEEKPWWQSKMVWVQVITGLLSLAAIATDILGVVELPNEAVVAAWLKSADSVLNIILRALTKAPLTV